MGIFRCFSKVYLIRKHFSCLYVDVIFALSLVNALPEIYNSIYSKKLMRFNQQSVATLTASVCHGSPKSEWNKAWYGGINLPLSVQFPQGHLNFPRGHHTIGLNKMEEHQFVLIFFFLEGFSLVNFAEICLMISTLQCLGKCLWK